MKLIQKSLIAAACAGTLLFAGSAFASDTGNLVITADVSGVCKFGQTTDYTLDFGTLDPSVTTDATTTTNVTYRCTAGTQPTSFQVESANSPTTRSITNTAAAKSLSVLVSWAQPTTVGTGFGTQPVINIPVSGKISASELSVAPAGTYKSSNAITISP